MWIKMFKRLLGDNYIEIYLLNREKNWREIELRSTSEDLYFYFFKKRAVFPDEAWAISLFSIVKEWTLPELCVCFSFQKV